MIEILRYEYRTILKRNTPLAPPRRWCERKNVDIEKTTKIRRKNSWLMDDPFYAYKQGDIYYVEAYDYGNENDDGRYFATMARVKNLIDGSISEHEEFYFEDLHLSLSGLIKNVSAKIERQIEDLKRNRDIINQHILLKEGELKKLKTNGVKDK